MIPPDKKMVVEVPRTAFPETKGLKLGDLVQGMHGDRPVRAKVLAVGDKTVTLDFNHPLAGKTLNFAVEVLEVSSAGQKPS